MDQLRLILLIIGVALIAGIFIWELYKKRVAERRRARVFEHLSEEERSSFIGEIDQADPFEIVERAQERRAATHEQAAKLEERLENYDIDEDFPVDSAEQAVTRTPAACDATAPAVRRRERDEAGALGPLSGLTARRDGPEQLDLAGLELSAPARASAVDSKAPGSAGAERRQSDPPSSEADDEQELHIIMTVMAKSGERFSGNALRHSLESAHLYHGEMNIFHRHAQPDDRHTPTLFSAANVLAPGYFEPARMDSLSSPGIAMFMRLPGPERPVDAFQQMLDTARTLARDLDGTLCDETRSTLTPQSINHLRERIADFGRRQMIKA